MNTNVRTYAALSILILATTIAGCRDHSDSELESSPPLNLAGTWSGEAVVVVTEGGSVCDFFAGQYPIQWTFEPNGPGTFGVFDSGFLIGSAVEDPATGQAVITFRDVQNESPATGELCHGSEQVILSALGSDLSWEYQGSAACGATLCRYQGSANLVR